MNFKKIKTVSAQINDSKYNLGSKAGNNGWYVGKMQVLILIMMYHSVICDLLLH